jgi:hypothetical protein
VLVSATTRTFGAGSGDLGVDLGLGQWWFETGELPHGVEQPINLALFGPYTQKVHEIFYFRTLLGREGLELLDQGLDGLGVHRITPVEVLSVARVAGGSKP